MPKIYLILIILLVGCLIIAGFLIYFNNKPAAIIFKPPVYHYSYFSKSDFFDQAYLAAKTQNFQPSARAIMVSHHLLAADLIAETFGVLKSDEPVTILLISPNHFSAGDNKIITSEAIWQTPYGEIQPDYELINSITVNNLVSVEEGPFDQEHGVSGIVPFIKKSLPNAKIVPIIVKDSTTIEQAIKTADEIFPLLPQNAKLVLSFDFSHYLTDRAAVFHDLNSLAAMENFDLAAVSRLDVDSRPGLAMAMELLKNFGSEQFNLLANTNSSKLTGQDILETTSYLDGYFCHGSPASEKVETILFFPPVESATSTLIGFDRHGENYSVEYLERLFTGQDKTVATIINNGNFSQANLILNKTGFTDISIGSQKIQAGDLNIQTLVLPATETFSQKQALARNAINNGADVVLVNGNYDSPLEIYKNRLIIYGQGSGLNDLSLNNGSVSVAYGLAFKNNELSVTILPIASENGKYKLLIGKLNDTILSAIAENSEATLGKQIKQGLIIINLK
jgi:AmmeMemoRadiSam system protein B